MSKGRTSFVHRLRHDQRGQALIFAAVAMVGVFAVTAFAIDTVHVLQLRRELQASTDAAALVTSPSRGCSGMYSGSSFLML